MKLLETNEFDETSLNNKLDTSDLIIQNKSNDKIINESDKQLNIDTKLLSNKLKKFLFDNNITQTLFNNEIVGLSIYNFHLFLKKPLDWLQYHEKTRKKLENIDKFLKDNNKIDNFLIKHKKLDCLTLSSNNNSSNQIQKKANKRTKSKLNSNNKLLNKKSNNKQNEYHLTNDDINDFNKIEAKITTKQLAQWLNNELNKHKINKIHFSKRILNLQNSITLIKLLNEPREWSTLSDSMKNHFKKIYLWLINDKRIEFLQNDIKSSRVKQTKNANIFDLNDYQLNELNKIFYIQNNQYPTIELINYLSDQLSLSVGTLINWFSHTRGDDDDIDDDHDGSILLP